MGSVKNWAIDQGRPEILALYNEAHDKWTAANTVLQQYRDDIERRGRAEVEGDTEAGARARQAAENSCGL
eukprot:8129092-Prorocentrum_lima.AAC.1